MKPLSPRDHLLARRRELVTRYRDELDRANAHEPHAELVDVANDRWDTTVLSTMTDTDARALAEVIAALHRVDAGSYGVCTRCKGRVRARRLRAIPEAALCADCAGFAEQRRRRWVTVALVLFTACAGPATIERPGARGLRADQHVAIAHRESERAGELARWPDAHPGSPADQLIGVWSGTWDTTAEHRRVAAAHFTAAAELEAAYEDACGDTPATVAAVSPLRRYGIGGSRLPDGTLVLLSPDAGPPARLLAALRCHRAWMMLGRADMEDCPLDLPGLRVSARGDIGGIELALTVDDRALVPELQRRTARDLER